MIAMALVQLASLNCKICLPIKSPSQSHGFWRIWTTAKKLLPSKSGFMRIGRCKK